MTITNNDMVLVFTRGALSTEEPSEPASLIGTWKLTSYGTADAVSSALADVEANLTFNEDGTVTGTSGCNEFGGSYTVEGDQITFEEIVSTLKLCDDDLDGTGRSHAASVDRNRYVSDRWEHLDDHQ